MARDSKAKRKLRRAKRERSIAISWMKHLSKERDAYKSIAIDLRSKIINDIVEDSKKGSLTIRKIDEPEVLEGETVPDQPDPTQTVENYLAENVNE